MIRAFVILAVSLWAVCLVVELGRLADSLIRRRRR